MSVRILIDPDIKPKDPLFDAFADDAVNVHTTETALTEALVGTDVLVTTSRLPVTGELLANTSLSMVAKVGTGLNNIALDAAAREGTTVVYTPGMNARSVAEHSLTLLLTVKRNVVTGQQALQSGSWRDEVPNARPVTETTVGLVGFGNVGSRFAGLLDGFNANVLAYDPYVHRIDTEITGATLTDLETVLTESDAVVITAELTDETRGMIDGDAFDAMNAEAVLVNTARGPIVDHDALVTALESGKIAGAGLDVYHDEPLSANSQLHDLDNVVTTPHIAASSRRARTRIVETLARCIRRFHDGDPISERFVAAEPDTDG